MSLTTSNDAEMLLSREASLAAMSLGVGLTHMGSYNYAFTGFFYSGMFSLCVGLERVLKLIVIYDHRLRHSGKFPTNQELKSYGHKLSDLLTRAENIADNHALEINKGDIGDSLHPIIIRFITDFANNARYYNLDTLTGRSHNDPEPLVRWDKEVCTTLISRHYHPSERRKAEIDLVAAMMGQFAHIQHTSDSGQSISDARAGAHESAKIETKQKYSKYYLYTLVRFVCEIQRELEYKGNFYPYLREFFTLFTSRDRRWVLHKKSWNPYPPYHF